MLGAVFALLAVSAAASPLSVPLVRLGRTNDDLKFSSLRCGPDAPHLLPS
jgi:hypothetical protein